MTKSTRGPLRTLVFLGAGASAAEGAPIQSTLFQEYFTWRNNSHRPANDHDREISKFFEQFFGIDTSKSLPRGGSYPTFEEILGILEIADAEEESFKHLRGDRLSGSEPSQIRRIHDLLVFSIAEILDYKLKRTGLHHPLLVRNLQAANELSNTTFISLNYDILIDNALIPMRDNSDLDMDYAIHFNNAEKKWARPRSEKSIPLLKLHGSLNWLHCPICREITITPKTKGICKLITKPSKCLCAVCGETCVPVIIPPTYFKVLSNLHLRNVWHRAEHEIRRCDRWVFCGYSLPDADVHIRYMLKRAEQHRTNAPLIYVINNHESKDAKSARWEEERYKRFFRDKAKVFYTELSFERYVAAPTALEGVK